MVPSSVSCPVILLHAAEVQRPCTEIVTLTHVQALLARAPMKMAKRREKGQPGEMPNQGQLRQTAKLRATVFWQEKLTINE